MFYGFDSVTLKCHWAIQYDTPPTPNIIVVESNEEFDLRAIKLEISNNGTYSIATIPISVEEVLLGYRATRESKMSAAKSIVELLTDVVELEPTDDAKQKLASWKKYRVALYNMDLTDIEKVVWPTEPEAS